MVKGSLAAIAAITVLTLGGPASLAQEAPKAPEASQSAAPAGGGAGDASPQVAKTDDSKGEGCCCARGRSTQGDGEGTQQDEHAGHAGHGGHGGHGGMGGGCPMMHMKHGQAGASTEPAAAAEPGPSGDDGPSSVAFAAVAGKMRRDMAITYTGAADADFAALAIAQDKAAIDLARIALSFGKDPETRKQIEAMIRTREAELASLDQLVARNQKTQTTP